jgi:phosphate transport system substrate-binding protein
MTRRFMGATMGFALAMSIASAADAKGQQVLINGAGASFPYPMYSKWFDDYHKKLPAIQFNYQPIGSGGGVTQVTTGTVDFGASDFALTPEQLKAFKDKHGYEILHFPTVMGAVVPVYNLASVSAQLNFTGDALAGIYLGTIKKWNDPAIASANPGVNLPANDIVVVHRAESSGTSFCFTDYLTKVNKDWETKVGRAAAVNWPLGLGGKGNEGVSGQVKQTPNAIGYVELVYAAQNKMTFGKVKNSAGDFVQASLASVTDAAASGMKEMPDDFRVSITNAPGKKSYPISTFTWLLVPEKIADPAKKTAIVEFLKWMLSTGQGMTAALDFAPLPKPVVAKELKAIAKIQ